mgnify:CR=1 FL=1
MNRIEPILTELNETMDTEDQMLMIMDALNDTVTPVPEPGTLCTFQWGFRGFNFHWRKYRQYTWDEINGQVYLIQRDELDELNSVQYAKFVLNN